MYSYELCAIAQKSVQLHTSHILYISCKCNSMLALSLIFEVFFFFFFGGGGEGSHFILNRVLIIEQISSDITVHEYYREPCIKRPEIGFQYQL